MVENDIDDDNNEENMTEVFYTKTKRGTINHENAIGIVNRYVSNFRI